MSNPPFSREEDGLRLAVRVTPRAKNEALAGVTEDADGRAVLAVRLAAPPVDGAANAALIAFLARMLELPKSSVCIRSGETSRLKILHLRGEAEAIAAKLERLIARG